MSHVSHPDDEMELLEKISQGDQKAFRILFQRYYKLLGSHLERLTKSNELAEEVVQDVFVKIWQNRETLSSVNDFKAYLYVLSKNHAFNCLKKIASEQSKVIDFTAYLEVQSNSDEEEWYAFMDEAIDRLPPQQKQVYLLSRHERLQYIEIAKHMNISKETVKKYLQIATESISRYVKKKVAPVFVFVFHYFF